MTAHPNSWVDDNGREHCYACGEEVTYFKEGYICSKDCPDYKRGQGDG